MNEENNFSIDVDAETNAMGISNISDAITPSEFIVIQTESNLPEPMVPQPMDPNLNLQPNQNLVAMDVQNTGTNSVVPSTMEAMELNAESQIPQLMEVNAQIEEVIPFEATDINPTERIAVQYSSTSGIDFNVKIEAEEVYKKTQMLEAQLGEMKGGFKDMYENLKNSWLPLRDRDEFEERPTTEATNLVFEARRDRMSMIPHWA
jgi:hypothetical protein